MLLHKRKFKQLDWITGEGYGAKTVDLKGVTGILHKIEVKVSTVSGTPSVTVVLSDITDTDFVTTLETLAGLGKSLLHKFLRMSKEVAVDKDIDGHVFIGNDLRITVTPTADPGGTLQTLEVDVTLYLEE